MSKTLVVFGATGQQGGSVVNHVLNDPELRQSYNVRCIARDVNSEKALALKEKKAEVVYGDMLDPASLATALSGAHTVFIVTTPSFGPDGLETEYNMAKTLADAAVSASAAYMIFSTLPHVTHISGGKYTRVSHFDAKAKAEQYIRGLPIKSAFISPGFYMENFQALPFLGPQKIDDSTWAISRLSAPEAQLPLIHTGADLGKFVGAILAEPERFEGTTLCAASALYSYQDTVAIMSRATGKRVVYRQLGLEEFKQSLPFAADIFADTFRYPGEFGYYGPDSKELVAWAAGNARGRLSTLEEYLMEHPLQLE